MPLHSTSPSVYQHLSVVLNATQANKENKAPDKFQREKSLNALPEGMRRKIFQHICNLAKVPPESDYGQKHVFGSLPRLQRAVQEVIFQTLESLHKSEHDAIVKETLEAQRRPLHPLSQEWIKRHVMTDPIILLQKMHKYLEDLTPEAQQILDTWVAEGEAEEQRAEARDRIVYFLKNANQHQRQELNLEGLGLKSLPSIFDAPCFASQLKYLFLSRNKLTTLPDQIGKLENLKFLFLEDNQLATLPEQVCQLWKLKELSLSNNRFITLPDQIGKLENLKFLHLENNQLATLPEPVCQLRKLRVLNLNNNQLTVLPERIDQLFSLTFLSISTNRLTTLPKGIGNLTNLKFLDLSGNQLITRPKQIDQLHKLEELRLHTPENLTPELEQILELWVSQAEPEEQRAEAQDRIIFFLQNIQQVELNLNTLNLKSLPPIFDKGPVIERLKHLHLSHNKLTALPEQIDKLKKLKSLELEDNWFTTLPEQVCQLWNLETLNLNNNQLTDLPWQIGGLLKLKSLSIGTNQLTTLPEEIGHLRSLESLDLSNNSLTTLPGEIGHLRDLKALDLSHNSLTTLPEEIGNLTKLESLDLSNNSLTALPKRICDLKNLKSLDLSGNQFVKLSDQIGQLYRLERLNLQNNQLTTLPNQIRQLYNLAFLNLASNNLQKFPDGFLQLSRDCQVNIENTPLLKLLGKALEEESDDFHPFLERPLEGSSIRLDALRHPFFSFLFPWRFDTRIRANLRTLGKPSRS